jgi:translocation and assembly module TamB
VRWQALRISTAAIDPGRIDLCGLNGSTVRIGALALQGSLGDNPLSLKVKDARYALQSGRFDVTGVDGQIGSGEDPIIFQAALIDGSMGKDGSFGGSLTQGRAIIGPVPLEQSDIAGTWRFANGALAFDGAARVTDRQAEARFMPLSLERTHLSFADGRIDVRGAVVHPIRKAQLANVTISHMLGSGEGRADFTVDDLTFGQAIQPDDITPMALGVIANVEGAVQGKGAIRWSSAGVVSSDGIFSTQDMNFAAAFGPVTGFATTINFTDLLAMRTAPHQRLTMKQVSSGVDVFDGVIDYALLSNEQARIEGGHWPFSGGVLELLPATLELDARRARHFIFRVTGLDAGAFIQTMEIANISATGTFDGSSTSGAGESKAAFWSRGREASPRSS